jgi:hypothetical protein
MDQLGVIGGSLSGSMVDKEQVWLVLKQLLSFFQGVTGTGKVNTTEEYNGSTWSNVPGTMAVA